MATADTKATRPGGRAWPRPERDPVLQRIQPKGIPLLYGEEDLEMGEADLHTRTCDILIYGLEFHLAPRPSLEVFGNLNLFYSDEAPERYVSPDVLVVEPTAPLSDDIRSYRIGEQGPAPVFVAEVLSFRTWQQGDLNFKPILYGDLGIEEYALVDPTGDMLPERLLLLRRQSSGQWLDSQDADGGITSQLGFRIVIEADGQVRVLDARTGKRYIRPREAQATADDLLRERKARQAAERAQRRAEKQARTEAEARREAEERLKHLQEEVAKKATKPRDKGKQ